MYNKITRPRPRAYIGAGAGVGESGEKRAAGWVSANQAGNRDGEGVHLFITPGKEGGGELVPILVPDIFPFPPYTP